MYVGAWTVLHCSHFSTFQTHESCHKTTRGAHNANMQYCIQYSKNETFRVCFLRTHSRVYARHHYSRRTRAHAAVAHTLRCMYTIHKCSRHMGDATSHVLMLLKYIVGTRCACGPVLREPTRPWSLQEARDRENRRERVSEPCRSRHRTSASPGSYSYCARLGADPGSVPLPLYYHYTAVQLLRVGLHGHARQPRLGHRYHSRASAGKFCAAHTDVGD